jgi:hypothetical protein
MYILRVFATSHNQWKPHTKMVILGVLQLYIDNILALRASH